MLETLFGQRLTAGKNSMRIIINRALLMRTMMRVYSEDVVMMRMTKLMRMMRMTMKVACTGQNSTTPSSSSSHQVRRRATTWSCRTTTAAATCSPPSSKTPPAATTTSVASHCWMSKIFPFWDSTSASV